MTTMLEAVRSRLSHDSVVKPLYAGKDHTVALIGPCLAILVRLYPAEGLEYEAPRWLDALLEVRPEKGGLIIVFQTGVASWDKASFVRIEQAHHEYARGVAISAFVIEGNQIGDKILRTRLKLKAVYSNYPWAIDAFSYVGEGALFLARRLPGSPGNLGFALARGVEDLRAAYARVPPDELA